MKMMIKGAVSALSEGSNIKLGYKVIFHTCLCEVGSFSRDGASKDFNS